MADTWPNITLILGGARSGKSEKAEALALATGLQPLYLATATAMDGEMARRIAIHRARREKPWITVEEPLELPAALARHGSEDRVILVDCLTLWLSNLMAAGRSVADEIAALSEALIHSPGPVILVSNEVGLGLVPETALGREFRDWQGRLNQAIARDAQTVLFMAAGLPLVLKDGQARGEPLKS